MGRVIARRKVLRIQNGLSVEFHDSVAAEEPMEIRIGGRSVAITMRTPGHDFDLAVGFLLSEGVVRRPEDVRSARYCAGATTEGRNTYNIVEVGLDPAVGPLRASLERNFYTTSACGLCGKASLEAVRTASAWRVDDDPVRLPLSVLRELPAQLREAQRVFDRTGGLHAAGLFTSDGEQLIMREDVGRHNAVDKVIGNAILNGMVPLRGTVLMVSGRASFELVQKAVMGGIPALAAVSAPSSLAIELAEDAGLTLIGFLRGDSMNVYAGAHRIKYQ